MSNHQPLALLGEGYKLQIIPAAIELRDQTIAESSEIKAVNSEESKTRAIEKAALLKGLIKGCENCRVEIKGPALAIASAIDTEAKNFAGPAKQEIQRLERLAGDYVSEQRRIADQQRMERERKEREAREQEAAKLKKQQDEEAARKRAIEEEERKALNLKTAAARKIAEEAAAKLREADEKERKRIADEQAQAEIDRAMAEPVPEPVVNTSATGAAVGSKIEIFEHDLHALYAAHPQCVTLTINKNAVKDLVKLQLSRKETVDIPGVEISLGSKLTVRATQSANLLK